MIHAWNDSCKRVVFILFFTFFLDSILSSISLSFHLLFVLSSVCLSYSLTRVHVKNLFFTSQCRYVGLKNIFVCTHAHTYHRYSTYVHRRSVRHANACSPALRYVNKSNTGKKFWSFFSSVTFNWYQEYLLWIMVTLEKKVHKFFSVLHLIDTRSTYYE